MNGKSPIGKNERVRVIDNIRGVDFSGAGDPLIEGRLPVLENMYRNYSAKDGARLESIPGFRLLTTFKGVGINSIHSQRVGEGQEYLLVHAGTKLYRIPLSERDSISSPVAIATLENCRSVGFSYHGDFYLLDGTRILRIDSSGAVATVGDEGTVYSPITRRDGVELEQSNLLGGVFSEEYTLTDPHLLSYGTPELKYKVISEINSEVEVSGVEESFSGVLYIPSTVTLGKRKYRVRGIADGAFYNNTALTGLFTAKGLLRIGEEAFSGCTSLEFISISDTVEVIESSGFASCFNIATVYLGEGLAELAPDAFYGVDMVNDLYYAKDAESFRQLISGSSFGPSELHYFERDERLRIRVPILTPTSSVISVSVEGVGCDFQTESDGSLLRSVVVSFDKISDVEGRVLSIRAEAIADAPSESEHGADVRKAHPYSLIGGCRVACVFDGRIFLSGNPASPNEVFFSTDKIEGGLYFGALDYISDGSGAYGVRAMTALGDTLAVMKSADAQDGGVFYHKRHTTASSVRPVEYSLTHVHYGVSAKGDATVFSDTPLFLSELGLTSLEQTSSGIGRKIVCKSYYVNNRLLSEDLDAIRMASWQGYLVLSAGTRMYLADPRAGSGYEWFYLTNVGVNKNPTVIYRYHSLPYSTRYKVYDTPDAELPLSQKATAISGSNSSAMGKSYYTAIGGVRYHVYATEEKRRVDLSPVSALSSVGELLFFGTTDGALCVFNNDKIGEPPERLATQNPDESDIIVDPRELHPDYYSFAGVRARYAIGTGEDDLGLGYLRVSAVSSSTVVEVEAIGNASLGVNTHSEGTDFRDEGSAGVGVFSFFDLAFDNFTFETERRKRRIFRQRERGFAARELTIVSDRASSPIAIRRISYRYKISGRIKAR